MVDSAAMLLSHGLQYFAKRASAPDTEAGSSDGAAGHARQSPQASIVFEEQ